MRASALTLPQEVYEDIRAHALVDSPCECCGLLALDGDRVVKSYRATNAAEGPIDGFLVHPLDQLRVTAEIENDGREVGVYHSHPRAEATLSPRDLDFALPGMPQIVVGMATGFVMRAFRIEDGEAVAVPIEVAS